MQRLEMKSGVAASSVSRPSSIYSRSDSKSSDEPDTANSNDQGIAEQVGI